MNEKFNYIIYQSIKSIIHHDRYIYDYYLLLCYINFTKKSHFFLTKLNKKLLIKDFLVGIKNKGNIRN
jgi:hypothetical protein